jgi:hypothetical protein
MVWQTAIGRFEQQASASIWQPLGFSRLGGQHLERGGTASGKTRPLSWWLKGWLRLI